MDPLRKGIAIGMLFGSGGGSSGPNLMEKTVTENGVYTASEEIDPETGEIFDPPKDGYSVFTVDLALDDKSVSLTTSQITGSQTAVFEYDPHDENPELEGYSLFTIDLSAVKTDIEAMQAQIEDLEDELEEMQECCDEVLDVIHEYDPPYDPHPDPPDPTNPTIPEKIQEIIDEESGFDFPVGTDPETDIPPIFKTNGALEDVTTQTTVFEHNLYTIDGEHEYVDVGMAVQYYDSVTQQYVTSDCAHWGRWRVDGAGTQGGAGERIPPIPVLQNYTIDGTNGTITAEYLYYPFWNYGNYTTTDIYSMPSTMPKLVGWGSTADTYKIKNV